ncbi:MAG: hypothetical protein HY553_12150 [Elusimicrobia bacterium]|nr:hypothetical protein [Elusimicrobiota bacterium]
MAAEYIHFFGAAAKGRTPRIDPKAREELRELLGGKGAGLAEMTSAGLPVPPGFTITTEVCRRFYAEEATR